MSASEESGAGSDFEPERDQDDSPDTSPQRPVQPPRLNTPPSRNYPKRGRPKKGAMAEPETPESPRRSHASQDQDASPAATNKDVPPSPANSQPIHAALQQPPPGFILPAVGPGGIPIILPTAQNGTLSGNERAHLYTLLKQLPIGFPARADGQSGTTPAALPFPFPMHPGLLAAANIADGPLPSAHDAEAPPEGDSPGRGSTFGSPHKPRPEPGSSEWARQRKDNHKEVERRRRGNINEGINELARLIPAGHGEKAKGAVLQRAVAYVKDLQEKEQKNIERWTMEKLTHEQVVAEWASRYKATAEDLEKEKKKTSRLEAEVIRLKAHLGEREEDELAGDEEEEDDEEEIDLERPAKRMRVA
ncbi:SubName: Full=Probable CBF1-centromere binding factor 1 {ECO:0000313/EMBL:CCA72231.1} [Serendipita indica DSM 11827]|nr:SubName: Full=Probable CBF1-centromere binding factor 1 {ECO:0000313/EMBL:CCA72231.1} [Serendipita indica DSM 11827]